MSHHSAAVSPVSFHRGLQPSPMSSSTSGAARYDAASTAIRPCTPSLHGKLGSADQDGWLLCGGSLGERGDAAVLVEQLLLRDDCRARRRENANGMY